MNRIFVTSDTHFCHDREFVFVPRGFKTIQEMNETIVKNWNNTVNLEDEVYLLGDIMLNDNVTGIELLKSLNGKIHIVFGNHDTESRKLLYSQCENVVEVNYALMIKNKKYNFYLSHYPTMTSNLEKEKLSQCIINLYGHTHQKSNFYQDIPFMYHVGMDSHNCTPVEIEKIIYDCKKKVLECKNQL